MSELPKKCVPCTKDQPPLKGKDLETLYKDLEEGWELKDEKQIEKVYKFKNFREALAFVNDIGQTAEEQGHHPDIELGWGRVKITYTTHKIGGLSTNDFLMALKTDALYASRQG